MSVAKIHQLLSGVSRYQDRSADPIVSNPRELTRLIMNNAKIIAAGCIVAVLTACCGWAVHAGGPASDSSTAMAEYVQVTRMRLDAGVQTFESFRILRDGTAQWARWNSLGRLLAQAGPKMVSPELFDSVVSHKRTSTGREPADNHGIVRGRPASRVSLVHLFESKVEMAAWSDLPDDIAAVQEQILGGLAAMPVQPGWYVWTEPVPLADQPDLTISETDGNSALVTALLEAAVTGRLIVRAGEGVSRFMSGARAHRIVFKASVHGVGLGFGILSHKER